MLAKTKFCNIVVLFASLLTAVLIGEIALRLFMPQIPYVEFTEGAWLPDKDTCYTYKPYLKSEYATAEFRIGFTTDSKGIRDREFGEKTADKYRILIIGDSFTWGAGAEQNETYPKDLEQLLNRDGEKYEVINAGVSSYDTRQEYFYLLKYGLALKPDMVIVGFVPNDVDGADDCIMDVNSEGNLVSAENKDIRIIPKHRLCRIPDPFTLSRFLSLNSHVYVLFTKVLRKFDGKKKDFLLPEEVYEKDGYQTFEVLSAYEIVFAYLKMMKMLCDSKNVKFELLAVPMQEQMNKDDVLGSKFDIQQPQKALRRWSGKNGVFFIDPLEKFRAVSRQKRLYWKHDAHMNKQGYSLLAAEIYEHLLNNNLLKQAN